MQRKPLAPHRSIPTLPPAITSVGVTRLKIDWSSSDIIACTTRASQRRLYTHARTSPLRSGFLCVQRCTSAWPKRGENGCAYLKPVVRYPITSQVVAVSRVGRDVMDEALQHLQERSRINLALTRHDEPHVTPTVFVSLRPSERREDNQLPSLDPGPCLHLEQAR
jgi:hypothetical protein